MSEKKVVKKMSITLTHKAFGPYAIKVDSYNITVVKDDKSIGYFSQLDSALDRIAKLRTLELTEQKFGEIFPLDNYIKSLYKVKNVFKEQSVQELNNQIKQLQSNE